MRQSNFALLLLFCSFITSLSPAKAAITPIPVLDVTQLANGASVIAIGSVISVREEERGSFETQGQTISARRMTAFFRVERVLKGEPDVDISFKFFLPDQGIGFASITPSQFGIFFFRSGKSGLELVSPYYPFILAARQGCGANEKGVAGIVAELVCILQSPSSATRERAECINSLRSVKTAEANIILKRAARELSAPLNLVAAGVLLSRDEISILPIIEPALLRSSMIVVEGEGYRSEGNLSLALTEIKNPAAIPSLSRLLESVDTKTRRSATQGLRSIGTRAAIKPLAKALYDNDWEVRWIAVMGLAGIVGPDKDSVSWYPAYDEFKRNETRYLNHWRDWAEKK